MRSGFTVLALLAVMSCASTSRYDEGGIVQDHASTVERGGVGNYLFPADYHDHRGENERQVTQAEGEEELWTMTQSSPTWQPNAELVGNRIEISDEIRFEHGSARLTADSERILDDVAKVIQDNQNSLGNIEVAGHTDSTGTRTGNQTLSEVRARAVRDYLISKGVAEEKLIHRGYGDTDPKYDPANSSAEELAQNRRVEFRTESSDSQENIAE